MPVCGSSTEEGGHDWLTLFLKSLMSETGCLQALDAFYDEKLSICTDEISTTKFFNIFYKI